jgi:hypothetical protein
MRMPIFNIICIVLVLPLFTGEVNAGQLGPLTYELAGGKIIITDCNNNATKVEIPSEIEGFPVKEIWNEAFLQNTKMTSIKIAEGVRLIGRRAFRQCSGLTSIKLPDTLDYIGASAFSYCLNLGSLVIPEKVTQIDDYTFHQCSKLASIQILGNVRSIGNSAFLECENLNEIIIPDSVTTIGAEAFSYCQQITSITIPEGVTSIGWGAFLGSERMISITIPSSFHSQTEAVRLGISGIWPQGFRSYSIETTSPPTIIINPPAALPTTDINIRMVPAITVTGRAGESAVIDVSDTADGPWMEWRTVVIDDQGTTEVDLDEGASKRFYRVR